MALSSTIAICSFCVAVLSCIAAIANAIRGIKKDAETTGGQFNEILTKLDFLSENIREIKTELQSTDKRLDDVRDIAINAEHKADDALRRLKVLEHK